MDDLFDLADSQSERRRQEATDVVASALASEAAIMTTFMSTVEADGRPTTNMGPSRIEDFVTRGRLTSATERAREVAQRDGIPYEDAWQETQKAWAQRRRAFEEHFGGTEFTYGALNIGSLGPAGVWGDWCVVFSNGLLSHCRCACIPGNSAQDFVDLVDSTPTVDVNRLATSIGAYQARAAVALLKFRDKTIASPIPSTWPMLVCSDSEFVEIVYSSAPQVVDVEVVRVSKLKRKEKMKIVTTPLGGVAAHARSDAEIFRKVEQTLNSFGLAIEEL